MNKSSKTSSAGIVFVWENLGPMHIDRCEAAAAVLGMGYEVMGWEYASSSGTYSWEATREGHFRRITLFPGRKSSEVGQLRLLAALLKQIVRLRPQHIFICHYEQPSALVASVICRILGLHVYTMGCSKFDDMPRSPYRELAKRMFLFPYMGAIGSGRRGIDYFRFMGIDRKNIFGEYNTLSIERIRKAAVAGPAPDGIAYEDRHFTIVARLVEKKNIATALRAYSIYRANSARPRRLSICGDGPLEEELAQLAGELGVAEFVTFNGFMQSPDISRVLSSTLALLLLSKEEQFGNVVIEAQALGLPVILSDVCGARDLLVRSGVNGFVVEPDNPEGAAYFMACLDDNYALWADMCRSALRSSSLGDSARFGEAVARLVRKEA